jgi:dipeptidyl aminopeptidase/acylaminoacyl peptidase
MRIRIRLIVLFALLASTFAQTPAKPRMSFDEFFNGVEIDDVNISPDGRAVLIGTSRADWEQEINRRDLWLWREGGSLVQLTRSGHDGNADWSPDGKWIAFLSDRKQQSEKSDASASDEGPVTQVYLISASGGEAFPITSGDEEVHAFAWSADSSAIYFATTQPLTKEQKEATKKDWHDVNRWREAERGDEIFRLKISDALTNLATAGTKAEAAAAENAKDTAKNPDKDAAKETPKEQPFTPGAQPIALSKFKLKDLIASPNGKLLAFNTDSISSRVEDDASFEIYVVNTAATPTEAPKQLTHNHAIEENISWSRDSGSVFFQQSTGTPEKYEDVQPRVYSVDVANGALTRWASSYTGTVADYEITQQGTLLATGQSGTEVQPFSQARANTALVPIKGLAGSYEHLSAARNNPRVAFVYSAQQKPSEVYLADLPEKMESARPITSFNQLMTQRDLPEGKPYRWKSPDGTEVEGWLLYPPGKMGAKNLRMLTFIHGGPLDADHNHWEADWYQWAALAASNDWLVFEPNYRGSSGYGDRFALEISPKLVSVPGVDILAGVDALVKDGIADPDRLAIGGYSYGGYMTNWLLTQTTRFKAAVTGAGAVEHANNWGNDDLSYDDAWYLGGTPWENPKNYQDEAALFQINKVKTPTHMVAGGDDIRVAVSQDYLMERALHTLGVPSHLLIFPGEGHGLRKNPWHGRIKVREELQWLEKYVPAQRGSGR